MREGYLHGYFGAAFIAANAGFVRSYRETQPEPEGVRGSSASELGVGVGPMQRDVLWRVFRGAKKVGAMVGRWSAPVFE
jgi:hypothetical protein